MTAQAVALLRRTVEMARGRPDAMAQVMFEPVLRRMGPERELSSTDVAELRDEIARAAAYFLASEDEGREPTAVELLELHEIGARRARLAVPRHEMLASVDVAADSGRGYLLQVMAEAAATGEFGDDPNTYLAAADEITGRLCGFVSVMKEALTVGHDRQLAQPDGDGGSEVSLVTTLLMGRWADEAGLRDHARSLGRPLGRQNGLLLAVSRAPGLDQQALVRAAAECARRLPDVVMGFSRYGDTPHAVIVAPSDPDGWPRLLEAADPAAAELDLLLLAVDPVDELSELRHAYDRAVLCLTVVRAARRSAGLVRAEQLRLLMLLATTAPELRREYEDDVLATILDLADGEVLLDVFEARSTASAQEVGRRLHMSESGVNRALRRLAKLTGLDLDVPEQRTKLELGVRLHRLRAARSEALAPPLEPSRDHRDAAVGPAHLTRSGEHTPRTQPGARSVNGRVT